MNLTLSHFLCRFFTRIDRVLRRSLGVSESAKGEAKVKPAPERGNDDLEETISTHEGVVLPEELKDKVSVTYERFNIRDYKFSVQGRMGRLETSERKA
jgi:hypothetical protein